METPAPSSWTFRLVSYSILPFIAAVVVAVFTPSVDAVSIKISWIFVSAVCIAIFEVCWLVYRRTR